MVLENRQSSELTTFSSKTMSAVRMLIPLASVPLVIKKQLVWTLLMDLFVDANLDMQEMERPVKVSTVNDI